jgi:hypothetical protein
MWFNSKYLRAKLDCVIALLKRMREPPSSSPLSFSLSFFLSFPPSLRVPCERGPQIERFV